MRAPASERFFAGARCGSVFDTPPTLVYHHPKTNVAPPCACPFSQPQRNQDSAFANVAHLCALAKKYNLSLANTLISFYYCCGEAAHRRGKREGRIWWQKSAREPAAHEHGTASSVRLGFGNVCEARVCWHFSSSSATVQRERSM